MTFDRKIKAGKEYVLGIQILWKTSSENAMKEGSSIKYEILHRRLGHPGEQKVCDTAKMMGWKVSGTAEVCESCALAKSKQKNMNKKGEIKSKKPGERMMLDISSI